MLTSFGFILWTSIPYGIHRLPRSTQTFCEQNNKRTTSPSSRPSRQVWAEQPILYHLFRAFPQCVFVPCSVFPDLLAYSRICSRRILFQFLAAIRYWRVQEKMTDSPAQNRKRKTSVCWFEYNCYFLQTWLLSCKSLLSCVKPWHSWPKFF